MKKFGFVSVWCLLACGIRGGTVRWDVFTYERSEGGFEGADASLAGSFPWYGASDHGVLVGISETINLSKSTLSPITEGFVLAPGQYWRVFNEGDTIDYSSIFGSYSDYFFKTPDIAYSDRDISIPRNGYVYLGFATDNFFTDNPYRYGWVQLGFDGISVYVVNSAVDISGDSIIVGVPEPAALLLMVVGLATIGFRRRWMMPMEKRLGQSG